MTRTLLCAVFAFALAVPAIAQVAPPISRPGTMAIPSGNDKLYDAGEAAAEGVVRGVRAIKDALSAKPPLVDPLGGLLEGTTVVVRKGLPPAETEAPSESDQANVSEATVTHIDKLRTQLTLRFDDGKKAMLQLAEHAGSQAQSSGRTTASTELLSLTYTDDTGRKTTHVFTKIS
jgi:hypothetical protein